MSKQGILYILVVFLGLSCSKDTDLDIPGTVNPDPEANLDAQDFMWKAMNFWYFWQQDVPNLADDQFENTPEGIADYTALLGREEDAATFFDNQLVFSEDRFSFYEEDYRVLTQSLAGISRSNGLEFGLVRYRTTGSILGIVRYVVPGSDAATKDISRGDIFIGVDNRPLNVDNFVELLFGDNNTYTLNMGTFAANDIISNDKEVSLTKAEALSENPVFISKTFEIGSNKIGYLMYNGFTNEYDGDLNRAFIAFKNSGITDLIVDLRYNPGGSVNTTRLLGSMIYGTDTSELFLRKRYNDKLQPEFPNDRLEVNFTDKLGNLNITSVELSKVYVLTTESSASASELLINCLEPYIDVVQIGDNTRGKNEFSTTLVDDRGNSYLYNPKRRDRINPNVQWGLQPLIGRNENADGFSDYTDGLRPDIALKEDLENMGVLGDLREPLLARAIQEITSNSGKSQVTVKRPAILFSSSSEHSALGERMIDDTHY